MTQISRPGRRALARGILDRTMWLSPCGSVTLDRFVDEGKVLGFKHGEMVTRRGDQVDALCIVVEGTLEVSVTSTAGKRHVLAYLEPGQMMNLIPVLADQKAIHDARAHEDSIVLLIPKHIVLAAVDTEPGLARSLMRLLCLRSLAAYTNLADTALLTLRERCARALLSLIAPYGVSGPEGITIALKLPQHAFADMVGSTRQGVNRELRQFERDGIIKTTYSHLIIHDENALRSIASNSCL